MDGETLKGKKRGFVETVELQVTLKQIDPAKDKRFAGSFQLPNPTRAKINVCVFVNDKHEQLCKKAADEKSFAPIYALFTSKCTSAPFREKVARETITRFFEVVANPGRPQNEADVNTATGVAAFFGALLNEKAIQEATGHPAVVQLFEALEKEPPHSTHIEMLHAFITTAGSRFVKQIDPKLWEKLDEVVAKTTIKPRFKYLLMEVIEEKNKICRK